MNFLHKHSCNIKTKTLKQSVNKLEPYRKELNSAAKEKTYSTNESSLLLSSDKKILSQTKKLAKKYASKKLKFVVVIGIGGSNLGTKALFDALRHTRKGPTLLFLDTVSETKFNKIARLLKSQKSSENFLLVTISKSGSTTEVIANTEAMLSNLKRKFKNVSDRLVVITDENSKLWNAAKDKNVGTLSIPRKVGGRFSVLSNVGLFPLLVGGFDVNALRRGAQLALKENLKKNSSAALSATLKYLHFKKGRTINDSFFFAPELESLGKWETQLVSESIGKNKNVGITQTVSIGSTNLHSTGQLLFGGPKDKFTTVISTKSMENISIPKTLFFGNLVDGIKNKKIDDLMQAITNGTKKALQSKKLPFVSIELDYINEKEIGAYLQFRMIEIMYLAKLFQVNAFNQPAVEIYKKETRKHLS